MVRFDNSRRHAPEDRARSYPWRLVSLFLSLGLVVALMSLLERPQTAGRIERILSGAALPAEAKPVRGGNSMLSVTNEPAARAAAQARDASSHRADNVIEPRKFLPGVRPDLLNSIRDNSYFRSEESEAWFHLLQLLQETAPEELSRVSLGSVDYVQLVQQPEVYRGRVVNVRGIARRVETLQPADNDIGLEQYHLITLQPSARQIWPMRIYVLDVPDDLPLGEGVAAEIAVTGVFFKNWSYPWNQGLGLAPVILARQLTWKNAAKEVSASGPPTPVSLLPVLLAAAGLTLLLIGWITWNSRLAARKAARSRANSPDAEQVASSLNWLARYNENP